MDSSVDAALLCRFRGGDSIAALARDYELSVEEVENGLRRALGVPAAGVAPLYGERGQMATIAADEALRIGLPVEALLARDRHLLVARARRRAMWRCRTELNLPTTQIGLFFRRDHTTVLYAIASEEAERNGTEAPWRLKQARLRRAARGRRRLRVLRALRSRVPPGTERVRCSGCGLEGLAAEADHGRMACMFCGATEVTEVQGG